MVNEKKTALFSAFETRLFFDFLWLSLSTKLWDNPLASTHKKWLKTTLYCYNY